MLALEDRIDHRGARADRTTARAGLSVAALARSFGRDHRPDNAPLLALAGDSLAPRFRAWRGASDRRYVFSVYDRRACPAYEHAVIMIATVGPEGDRGIVFIGDSGCFPELVLAEATRRAAEDAKIEIHLHLLAASAAERAAAIADLAYLRRS